MRVRFNEFIFDSDRREFLRGDQQIPLRPKALDFLQILIENRPKAVGQDELSDRVWPTTFVGRANLHKLVHHIRHALGDADQAIVRTVYGFGFAFVADAFDEERSAIGTQWQLAIADQEFDLLQGENIIGRDRDVAVRIEAPSISRRHARIVIAGNRATLEDLGSKNGTIVRGKRTRRAELDDGDAILFGDVAAKLHVRRPERSTRTIR
ncbi:MAG TPA: FHA domain-containing protein [Thermoanaerobaculia bacterium]